MTATDKRSAYTSPPPRYGLDFASRTVFIRVPLGVMRGEVQGLDGEVRGNRCEMYSLPPSLSLDIQMGSRRKAVS
jgi:hypothetical protein